MKRVRIFFLFFKWMFFNAQCGRVLSPSKEGGGQREAHPKLALSPINIHSWIGFPSLLLFRDKCELKSVAADLRREASYTLAWGLRLKNKKNNKKIARKLNLKMFLQNVFPEDRILTESLHYPAGKHLWLSLTAVTSQFQIPSTAVLAFWWVILPPKPLFIGRDAATFLPTHPSLKGHKIKIKKY